MVSIVVAANHKINWENKNDEWIRAWKKTSVCYLKAPSCICSNGITKTTKLCSSLNIWWLGSDSIHALLEYETDGSLIQPSLQRGSVTIIWRLLCITKVILEVAFRMGAGRLPISLDIQQAEYKDWTYLNMTVLCGGLVSGFASIKFNYVHKA
jgi:hypothetical protein